VALIRDGLLALTTLGPAYGLQLRNELGARTCRALNGGQVYATLERMQRDGLIEEVDRTHDKLALISATTIGQTVASTWLEEPPQTWDEMVFKVLLARSLPRHSSAALVDACRTSWRQHLEAIEYAASDQTTTPASQAERASTSAQLAKAAQRGLALAALAWLDSVEQLSDEGWQMSPTRPPRGRRPSGAASSSQADI
jgi:DNA-binding PadR family transcriptional regulator